MEETQPERWGGGVGKRSSNLEAPERVTVSLGHDFEESPCSPERSSQKNLNPEDAHVVEILLGLINRLMETVKENADTANV